MGFWSGLFFLSSAYSSETVTAVDCNEGLQGRPRNTKTAKSHSQHLDPSHEWAESSEPQHGSVAADNGHMHEAKSQPSACEQVCRVWPISSKYVKNNKHPSSSSNLREFLFSLKSFPPDPTWHFHSDFSFTNQDKRLNEAGFSSGMFSLRFR